MKKILALVLVGLFIATLVGCGKAEAEKLKMENAQLRGQVAALEQEVQMLKEENEQYKQWIEAAPGMKGPEMMEEGQTEQTQEDTTEQGM